MCDDSSGQGEWPKTYWKYNIVLLSEYNSNVEKERLTDIMTYGEEGLPVIVKPAPQPPKPEVDRFDESEQI